MVIKINIKKIKWNIVLASMMQISLHQESPTVCTKLRVKALLVNGSITRLLRTKNYYNSNAER
jgi:hypothetical protein